MRSGLLRTLCALLVLGVLAGCGGVPIRPAESPPVLPGKPPGGLSDPGVNPSPFPRPEVGYQAPGFTARDVFSSEQLSLEGLRGTPVVLNFWATWCTPCKTEMPELEAFHQETQGKVRVIALGIDGRESPESLAAFAKSLNLTFTVAENGGASVEPYLVLGIPTTFFIDSGGIIRAKRTGPVSLKLLREWLSLHPKPGT